MWNEFLAYLCTVVIRILYNLIGYETLQMKCCVNADATRVNIIDQKSYRSRSFKLLILSKFKILSKLN